MLQKALERITALEEAQERRRARHRMVCGALLFVVVVGAVVALIFGG
jgi:uncharacterized membrane protein